MVRTVRASLHVLGDPGALVTTFEGDPERWLLHPRRDGASDRWSVTVHAGALHRAVRLTVGSTWTSGTTHWRSLSWEPVGPEGDATAMDHLLPGLDGELGLNTEPPDLVTLVLDGRYDPPGGRIGSTVDAVALHKVAEATAASFVAAVAKRLQAEASPIVGPDEPPGS